MSRWKALWCCGCLFMLLPACRDLTLPDPPPPVSARVRVSVVIVQEGAADVKVRAVRRLDERGNPATGTIPEDLKKVQPASLSQLRTVEFDFPTDATIIGTGTWDFDISTRHSGANQHEWHTTCTTRLFKDGLNKLEAFEDVATCTGDFALFNGQHEVEIGEVQVTPATLRVGDQATIRFITKNNGISDETFDVTVRTLGPGGPSLSTSVVHVANLPSGTERVVPTATEPPITWDTHNLPWGTYIVQASITTPIAGDPQPSNDSNSTFLELKPGDRDSDGVDDKIDNCPTVSNPDQFNCDAGEPGGELGDACDTPRLRSFVPSCNIPGGATVTVIGSGLGRITASDITLGTAKAAAITSQTACRVEFTNPSVNNFPTGSLTIATTPPIMLPVCCAMPTISAIAPSHGRPTEEITIIGCGFSGVIVSLILQQGSQTPIPVGPPSTDDQRILFRIPMIAAGVYRIVLDRPGMPTVMSSSLFRVDP
ncbi:MAG: IPT/TIG domain-containing protein [Nitrospira sp.]